MNREDLLLTDEEMDKVLAINKLPNTYQCDHRDAVMCQAQLDKVLKGNWVDKPDSEGWWWFRDDKGNCLGYEPVYARAGLGWFITFEGDKLFEWFPKGKFTKAIVPEKE